MLDKSLLKGKRERNKAFGRKVTFKVIMEKSFSKEKPHNQVHITYFCQ
jgi:hypothetical protein